MLAGAQSLRKLRGGGELRAVALAIVDAQSVAAPAFSRCHRENRGGIQAAGQEDDGGAAVRAAAAQRRSEARRVRALPAASEAGYLAMMSSSVLRALPPSPCSAWIAAMASIASGAFDDCG